MNPEADAIAYIESIVKKNDEMTGRRPPETYRIPLLPDDRAHFIQAIAALRAIDTLEKNFDAFFRACETAAEDADVNRNGCFMAMIMAFKEYRHAADIRKVRECNPFGWGN